MVDDRDTDPARWDRLTNVIQTVREECIRQGKTRVPIVINGDLYSRDDMIDLKRRTGCDGVMLARPVLYNASIFRKPPKSITAGSPSRYGHDSSLLLPREQVLVEYLRKAVVYGSNYKNTKYVVCEMMSNRRTPSKLVPLLPKRMMGVGSFSEKERTTAEACACQNMEKLCALWNVSLLSPKREALVGAKETLARPRVAVCDDLSGDGDGRRYDDRYFTDHDAYHRRLGGGTGGKKVELSRSECQNGGVQGVEKNSTVGVGSIGTIGCATVMAVDDRHLCDSALGNGSDAGPKRVRTS